MTETGDDNIKGILREISGIPSCGKYDTSIVETINVDELLVIPMAEEDGVKEDDTGSYVLRKIYAIGGMKIETNKYYEISGYMYPHPKNQESTILVTNATPLQDVVESFSLTEEVWEELDSLRPESMTVENIVSKLGTILNDLTYNVTHIVERDEVLLGLLLVYHSILRFRVPWDTDPIRGWVELKIVGDTGTGKSALVEKMMKYIGLGNRVNAESTSRTGLTYKMEQGNRGSWYIVWGAWPLADKELIWVDEDTGIEKDEYGEMTLARSDGKLEVKRAVTAETPCRVRAILSGNAPKGKRLSDYAQGAESLKDVFNNEDIRRFDFAIFMRSTDVDPEKYNRSLPSFPRTMSDDALKNNVLFAWSRTPEQVVFLPDTVDAILETATKLSKVYGNATDIPLVSPSDQRNKTFQGDYEGQELDYYYDLEFKEYVKLPQVKVKAKKYITVKKRDPKPVSKPSTSKNKKKTAIKKGDKVQFKGGPVYISSDASRPAVTRGKAKCNCTIVNSNKHPYHLIHYSGAMVYGWVNASDCEKI